MKTEAKPIVLIVDDEEIVLKLLERQLAEVPAKLIPTLSPAEAIHVLKSMEVAVLLCDLNMPEISGIAVLKTALEANPNVVSLVVTAGAEMAMAIKAINEGGIWKYLTKPWRQEELVDVVKKAIARYEDLCQQQHQLKELAVNVKAETRKLSAQQPRKQLVLSKKAVTEPAAEPAAGSGKKQIRLVKKGADKEGAPGEPPASEPEKGPKPIRLVKASAAPAKKSRAEKFAEEFQSDRYKLIDVLGESSLGVVYRAEDALLSDQVAVKIFSKKIVRDDRAVALLQECAKQAMQLSHKHIVRLHGVEKAGERYCTAMERVDGQSFREVLELYHKLPLPTVLQIGRVCAEALACAHRMKVVHGDLKPTNLLLTEDGVLKVSDFGDGVLADLQKAERDARMLPYMSPERLRGEALDGRADVYSLGMVLYELVTGEIPFPEGAADAGSFEEGPTALVALPFGLTDLFSQALAPRREERWGTIEEFARAWSEVTIS